MEATESYKTLPKLLEKQSLAGGKWQGSLDSRFMKDIWKHGTVCLCAWKRESSQAVGLQKWLLCIRPEKKNMRPQLLISNELAFPD